MVNDLAPIFEIIRHFISKVNHVKHLPCSNCSVAAIVLTLSTASDVLYSSFDAYLSDDNAPIYSVVEMWISKIGKRN